MYRFRKHAKRKWLSFVVPLLGVAFLLLVNIANWLIDGVLQNLVLNYLGKKFQPLLDIVVTLFNWANRDVIRWGWLFVIGYFSILIGIITLQVWKERKIRVEKGNSKRYTTLMIKNDTEDDFLECFIQLRDIDPKNVKKYGVYNSLPGFLYWTNMGQREERITIEAHQKHEFIIGISKDDKAYIPFYGDSAKYNLLPIKKEYDGDLLFKGITRENRVITKIFGVQIHYDGKQLEIKKVLL